MIIDFSVNCNNYRDKIFNSYSIFDYTCPKCGSKHSLSRHGSYERNICFMKDYHNIYEEKMSIIRLKCSSCSSTHAILPNDIIPYCIYSFSTIINILTRRYIKNEKILAIGEDLSISFQLIYNFISRFIKFLDSCLIVLKNLGLYNISTTPSKVAAAIAQYQNNNNNFLYQYFFNSKWMFLMTKFHNILSPKIFIGGTG